jgi:hypothetical protein
MIPNEDSVYFERLNLNTFIYRKKIDSKINELFNYMKMNYANIKLFVKIF